MKIEIIVDEHSALQTGLQALRRYNSAMFISLKDLDDVVDKECITNFFESKPSSEEERKYKEILVKAATMAMYNHPDIPQRNKRNCAIRCAKEFNEALMGAKGDYLREVGYFGVGQMEQLANYNMYQEKNSVVQTATTLSEIKTKMKRIPARLLKKHGVKGCISLISAGVTHLGITSGAIATGATATLTIGGITLSAAAVTPILVGAASMAIVDLAIAIIPKKTKQKIKDKAKEYVEESCNYIERKAEHFSNTQVGNAAKEVIEYVAPVVKSGFDFVCEKLEKAGNWLKSKWTAVKSFF